MTGRFTKEDISLRAGTYIEHNLVKVRLSERAEAWALGNACRSEK